MASKGFRYILPALIGRSKLPWNLLKTGLAVAGGAAFAYTLNKDSEKSLMRNFLNPLRINAATNVDKREKPEAIQIEQNDETQESKPSKTVEKKTIRGIRMRKKFLSYASVTYEGTAYMTPEDFMSALVEGPSRLLTQSQRQLTQEDVKGMLKAVPDLKKNSTKLFRSLELRTFFRQKGSERGFKIGFMMLDENASGKIELAEFNQLTELIGHAYAGTDVKDDVRKQKGLNSIPSTTLAVHLFGPSGRGKLSFDQFKIFVDNLWREMIEVEYDMIADPKTHECSVMDFGRIVLRYTHLDETEQAAYLTRLQRKSKERVTSEEFIQFNHFLQHLDDFRLAMRMYSIASVSVNEEELARAIFVACNVRFNPGLLELIYGVFDVNDDAKLSYREFVSILHDRLNRTLEAVPSNEVPKISLWTHWKKCVRQEFRRNA